MINLNQYKDGKASKEELEEFTNAFMRAKHDYDRKNRWQSMLQLQHDFRRDKIDTEVKPIRRSILMWAASAAAVVIAFVLWMLAPDTTAVTYEQLADNYLAEEFYENQEDSRGEQDVEQLNLQAIFAYNQKDFETAIGLYENIVQSGQANDRHYFFLGLSYLYLDRYDEAITNLQQVPAVNSDSKFIKEYRWFLALAYLKNKQVPEGRTLLISIQPNDWKYREAQLLLEAIDR